jgi:gliding motility-associated-like protein
MKKLKISLVLMLFVQTVFGQFNSLSDIQKVILQSEYWDFVDESSISNSNERLIVPSKYTALKLDLNQLKSVLSNAVLRTENDFSQGVEIQIPTPRGSSTKFLAFKNTTMSAGLEAKFPEIRSYDVVAVNNPSIKGKIDVTPQGFHAMIFTVGEGTYFVDPYARGDVGNYIVYNRKDFVTTKQMNCMVDSQSDFLMTKLNSGGDKVLGSCDLRTYRLAVSATGEYTAFHGGTLALAQAAQVTTMNRVNGMFERDAQITMVLIANNNLIVYTNAATDPFSNGNTGAMINENQTNTDAVIGSGNYDIGHIFGTNSGGLAQLQSPCGPNKARGVTGSGAPVGDPFDIDYVAHEMGHQFGGNHTQNNNCNRNSATAVEPGSASSIMGYAGICAPNVQSNSDDHFHGISVEEMSTFISGFGNTCAVTTATVNSSPVITGTNGNVTIPGGTPFALTAIATDPDAANVLSYCWEQTDNQVSTQPPVSTATGGPSFRSLSPVTNPTRYFPNLTDLIAGGPFTWEVLSTVNRTMNFRVSVRDNAGPLPEVSCIDIQDVTVTVDASSGPFVETYPSATGIVWTGATSETITWNEAGTASGAVSCANVDILLSTDGGLTYPTVLAANVPNTGTSSITVPNVSSATAVVMIMCSNGTFFDISDNVFTINAGMPPPTATACLDTVFYPESKRTNFGAYQLISPANFLQGVSQTYNSNTGTIHGINAYVLLDTNGVVGDAASKDVYIKVFNVDALNRPVGAAIDSNLVTLTDVGTARQTLMFTTPVPVSAKYAIAIELESTATNTDSIWFRGNNESAVPADGLGEGLLGLNFTFPGFGWTNYYLQFATADYDALIAPIFDKTIGAGYTTDFDTVCLGNDVLFTNTSILDTNYMYNRWDSLNSDPWIWNYGDGTGTYNHFDTNYTYTSAGTFTSQLLVTNYGYTNNCVDSVQQDIVIGTDVQASNDTVICPGGSVNLSAIGGAASYSWDNGLGAGSTHTVTPATSTLYTVTGTLISTAFTCSSTDSVFVAVAPCNCVDTVYYPQSKMTSFSGFNMVNEIDGFLKGVAQTYNSNTGFIHGVNALVLLDTNGVVGDAPSKDVYIKVFNVDALNRPVGAAIDSNLVTLTDVGTASQTLLFQSPVAVSARYAVGIELNPATSVLNNDTVWFLGNDELATPPNGQSEGLMSLAFSSPLFPIPGFPDRWYNYLLEFGTANYDALISPIFDKTIASSYTTDVDSVCLGDDVVFTNTATLDTNYMYNRWDSLNTDPWIWNYGDGTGTYNHFDTTYTFGAAGTFTTQLLVTNYGYTNNCVDSSQQDIEVIETLVIASADTAICLGDTVRLSATGATTYTWDNGLGAGQNQNGTPIIDTMFVVTGTGVFNCTGTDTVNVTINGVPTIIASNDTTVCAADSVFLSATGGETYLWDNGLGAGQNQTAFTSIDTMYIVTGTDTLGCSGLDTVQVTVRALPIVLASEDTTVCIGDTAIINATSTETVFTWDNGLGLGQSHMVSPGMDTSYVVSVTDTNNCIGTDTVQITIDGFAILASNDTTICFGNEVDLSVEGGTVYSWDNSLGSGELHIVSPEVTTTYIVTSDENGCVSMDTIVVTIDNMCFEVPNVFTPNGDGTNDVWVIKGLEIYPDITVKVFNRWGDSVFESDKGYTEPWDGTYNGTDSPSATYYYIIVLGDGEEGISGTINIVR